MNLTQPTRLEESTRSRGVLYLSLELGRKEWKLAFGVAAGQKPRLRTMAAGDLKILLSEIRQAKQRLGVREDSVVVSCYEAGRDGFWLHRALESLGIENVVVDSASMEVNRRARRAKTDRLDAQALLSRLIRFRNGEKGVWSVVRVPTPEQEDERHMPRELEVLKQERTSHRNRIQGLLASQGVRLSLKSDFLEFLDELVLWDGSAVPAGLKERLKREYDRLERVQAQIRELERQKKERLAEEAGDWSLQQVQQLMLLKGIGATSSWLFVREFFGWREFRNRREVAALAGLAPVPHQSGDEERERGISKAGNRRVRAMIIEIAWSWLRHQPRSRLSLWFQERFGPGSRRSRRVGIVALARKLLVDLWRYLQTGVVPDGAELKTVA